MHDNRRLSLSPSHRRLTLLLFCGALALMAAACSEAATTAPSATPNTSPTPIATIPIQHPPTVTTVDEVHPTPTTILPVSTIPGPAATSALPQRSTKPNLRLWSSTDQHVVGLQLEGNAVSVVLSPNIILAVEVLAGL